MYITGFPCSEYMLKFYLLVCFAAQVLKVCMTPDPTACLKMAHRCVLKVGEMRKNSVTGPRQPRTCMFECLHESTRQLGCFLLVIFMLGALERSILKLACDLKLP